MVNTSAGKYHLVPREDADDNGANSPLLSLAPGDDDNSHKEVFASKIKISTFFRILSLVFNTVAIICFAISGDGSRSYYWYSNSRVDYGGTAIFSIIVLSIIYLDILCDLIHRIGSKCWYDMLPFRIEWKNPSTTKPRKCSIWRSATVSIALVILVIIAMTSHVIYISSRVPRAEAIVGIVFGYLTAIDHLVCLAPILRRLEVGLSLSKIPHEVLKEPKTPPEFQDLHEEAGSARPQAPPESMV